MSKRYVYVEQEDGSTVERSSVNRDYTYAVCLRGVTIGQAKVTLKRDIERHWESIRKLGDEIRDLTTETPVEVATQEWGKDIKHGYTTYQFGTTTLNVQRHQSLEEVVDKHTSYLSSSITRTAEMIRRTEAAIDRLNEERDVDARVTTALARSVEGRVLDYLAPAVLGFSQSRDNAEKRATTEWKQRTYDKRDAVVIRTKQGKAPCSLKGFKQ